MRITFEDHALFHRTALRAALGAGLFGFAAHLLWFAPGARAAAPAIAAGALAALFAKRRPALILVAAGFLLAAVADQAASLRQQLLAAFGAVLALGVAEARAHRAREAGEPLPSPWLVALSCALAAAAGAFLPAGLATLGPALDADLPRWAAWPLVGALAGVWFASATVPLHLALVSDAVEERLAEVRGGMLGELRPLVDRVAAARREALAALAVQRSALSGAAVAALRAELDGLSLAALDLARRGAELSRAATPALDADLSRRAAELHAAAASASDALAEKSYRRAAETLDGQLEHLRVVRRGRDRLLARLHEEVAQLERARFSLLLLRNADAERSAAELEILSGRLRQSAQAVEGEAEVGVEVAAAAQRLRA